jgi:hypothetical protein
MTPVERATNIELDAEPWALHLAAAKGEALRYITGDRSNEVPTGMASVLAFAGDHVLIVSAKSLSPSVQESLARFTVSGFFDQRYSEVCTFEVDSRITTAARMSLVEALVPPWAQSRLDLIDWFESGDYFGGYVPGVETFDPLDLQSFFTSSLHQARAELPNLSNPLLRVVSQDSGMYLRILANPQTYVNFEKRLVSELEAAVDCPVVHLCAYEWADIVAASSRSRWPLFRRLRLLWGLLKAHTVVVYVDEDDRWHVGRRARWRVLTGFAQS